MKLVKLEDGSFTLTITKEEVEAKQEVARNKKGEVLGYKVAVSGGQCEESYTTINDNGKEVKAVRQFKVGMIYLSAKDLGVQKDKKPTVAAQIGGIMDLLVKMNNRIDSVERQQIEESQAKQLEAAQPAQPEAATDEQKEVE